jgi:hypothetical protein
MAAPQVGLKQSEMESAMAAGFLETIERDCIKRVENLKAWTDPVRGRRSAAELRRLASHLSPQQLSSNAVKVEVSASRNRSVVKIDEEKRRESLFTRQRAYMRAQANISRHCHHDESVGGSP